MDRPRQSLISPLLLPYRLEAGPGSPAHCARQFGMGLAVAGWSLYGCLDDLEQMRADLPEGWDLLSVQAID